MLENALKTLKTLEYGPDVKELTAELEAAIASSKDDPAAAHKIEAGLLDVLTGDSTHNGKDFACRKLKIVGSDASVSTLAAMLHDEKLAHMARYALESLPGDAATKALLDTLPKVSGNLKIGVISSLGARQANSAVASLAALLDDNDAAVARSAAGALGAIRTPDAAKALAAAKPNPKAIAIAVDASLACAEAMLASGDKLGALKMYRQLSKGDPPKHVKLAAAKGMLACAGE